MKRKIIINFMTSVIEFLLRYGYNVSLSSRLSRTTPLPLEGVLRGSLLRCSLPAGGAAAKSAASHQRSVSCSNSVSDSDAASSASSVQSEAVSAAGESVASGVAKKKSKSLLKQMKRRMSFTNNKGY